VVEHGMKRNKNTSTFPGGNRMFNKVLMTTQSTTELCLKYIKSHSYKKNNDTIIDIILL